MEQNSGDSLVCSLSYMSRTPFGQLYEVMMKQEGQSAQYPVQ